MRKFLARFMHRPRAGAKAAPTDEQRQRAERLHAVAHAAARKSTEEKKS